MPQYTTTLGDGLSDSGASFILSVGSGTDLMSDWNPTDTYQNGAFESNGITANTTQIALLTSFKLRLGGTASGYTSNADGNLQLASDAAGTGLYTSPTAVNTTGTTATYTASSGRVIYTIELNKSSSNTVVLQDLEFFVEAGETLSVIGDGTNAGSAVAISWMEDI